MIQGTYYKEWSRMLGRDMEFKVYGHAGTPVLALPARGGRFYDWENNGMPDAIAPLLNEGKVQLFCADSIDAESLLAGDTAPRRRAEMQEKYFNYLTSELAPRILTLNGAKKDTLLWAVGVDTGAYQAVNCRLRRPEVFAGAIGLSGLYDVSRFLGNAADDLVLRNAPLAYLAEDGLVDKKLLAKAEENALLLCAGQGGRRAGGHPGHGRCTDRLRPARASGSVGQRCLPRLVLVGQGAESLCRPCVRLMEVQEALLRSLGEILPARAASDLAFMRRFAY